MKFAMHHEYITDEVGLSMMQMRSLLGRQKVLQLFINITRWMHTVHTLHLLPPTSSYKAPLKPFFRPSPYNGEHSGVMLFKCNCNMTSGRAQFWWPAESKLDLNLLLQTECLYGWANHTVQWTQGLQG